MSRLNVLGLGNLLEILKNHATPSDSQEQRKHFRETLIKDAAARYNVDENELRRMIIEKENT